MDYEFHTLKKDIDVLGIYTFYYLEHTKDFYFSGERHDFWEMVYVDNGEISAIADNSGYMIHQGEVIFHKPMEFHALAANKKDPHNILIVTFKTNSETMRFFENKIFALDSRHKKILSLLLEEAQKTFHGISARNPLKMKEDEIGSQQLIINYLEQFLILLMRSKQMDDRSGRKSSHAKKNTENVLVENMERYLAEKVYENLTLQDVCRRFNMGKSYICQLFKETTGNSIMECFIQLKIVEAKKLIRRGNLNFTQISEKLGYNSIHNFTRSFKNKTGISPSSYAKSVRMS